MIVIVFTFCWSPFHAQRLLFLYVTLYSSWNIILRQINGVLFLSAGKSISHWWYRIFVSTPPHLAHHYHHINLIPKKWSHFYCRLSLLLEQFVKPTGECKNNDFLIWVWLMLGVLKIYSLLSTRFRAAFTLYVNRCCGSWTNANNQSTSGPRSRNNNNNIQNGGHSNSNNSMIVINGGHQVKNTCLVNEPGIVTKIQWNKTPDNSQVISGGSQQQSTHYSPQGNQTHLVRNPQNSFP